MVRYRLLSGEPQVFNNYGHLLMSNNCLPSCVHYILDSLDCEIDVKPEEIRKLIMAHLDFYEMADFTSLVNATHFLGMGIVLYGKMGSKNKLKSYKKVGAYAYATKVGLVLMRNHYWVIVDNNFNPLNGAQLPEIIEEIEFDDSFKENKQLTSNISNQTLSMVNRIPRLNFELILFPPKKISFYSTEEQVNLIQDILSIIKKEVNDNKICKKWIVI